MPQGTMRGQWFLMGAGLLILALILRFLSLWQSLWYDEMYTIRSYIAADWPAIVRGDYSPNNHILFTLLAKACTILTPPVDLATACRLPSAIAGSILPLLLAWPVFRARPSLAWLVVLLGLLNPWLVSYGGWARGYALLLCLGVAATALLQRWIQASQQRRLSLLWYVLMMAGVLYTHPLGIVLLIGHGVAIIASARRLRPWLVASAGVAVLAALLYLPLYAGAVAYFASHRAAPVPYATFLITSLSCALTGDGYSHVAIAVASVVLLVCGTFLAIRLPELRVMTISFAASAAVGLLVPVFVPTAGEARSMVWLIPLMTLALAVLLTHRRIVARVAGIAGVAACVYGTYVATTIPGQPMREAIAEARTLAGNRPVVGVYMGSIDASVFYPGIDACAYALRTSDGMPGLDQIDLQAKPILVIFYPEPLKKNQPDLWEYLQRHYRVSHTLPGRISPSLILEPW